MHVYIVNIYLGDVSFTGELSFLSMCGSHTHSSPLTHFRSIHRSIITLQNQYVNYYFLPRLKWITYLLDVAYVKVLFYFQTSLWQYIRISYINITTVNTASTHVGLT